MRAHEPESETHPTNHMPSTKVCLLLAMNAGLAVTAPVLPKPRILCLHGGGGTGPSFESAMGPLRTSMSASFDVSAARPHPTPRPPADHLYTRSQLVFATSPYSSGVWYPDPPGAAALCAQRSLPRHRAPLIDRPRARSLAAERPPAESHVCDVDAARAQVEKGSQRRTATGPRALSPT